MLESVRCFGVSAADKVDCIVLLDFIMFRVKDLTAFAGCG